MLSKDCERLLTNNRSDDHRVLWEQPTLRRLAANQAAGGSGMCNDGQGTGCGPALQHS